MTMFAVMVASEKHRYVGGKLLLSITRTGNSTTNTGNTSLRKSVSIGLAHVQIHPTNETISKPSSMTKVLQRVAPPICCPLVEKSLAHRLFLVRTDTQKQSSCSGLCHFVKSFVSAAVQFFDDAATTRQFYRQMLVHCESTDSLFVRFVDF